MKQIFAATMLSLMFALGLFYLLPNAEATYPCPSATVWMEHDDENPGKCIIKGDFCFEDYHQYYLRYYVPEEDGWSYILLYLNPNDYCEGDDCNYYTCAKSNVDCDTYDWEVGYDDGGWVKVDEGTVIPPL